MSAPTTRRDRVLITFAVMAATVMQVLDTTIVNVALPHMQGELGATPDQISWVLTSYLVASAIFMPLTGYFTDRAGRKRYLLVSIFGFVIASALCGIAGSIGQIVLFRLLQGVFGAALVPLSQAVMVDTYPPSERGSAMAIWGMGVMVGPILGPTLGGWLTDALSWRWTFYINVPVGILSLFLAMRYVPDTARKDRRMDWIGLVLLSAAIAGLQYVLDRGNQADWFDASDIRIAAVIGVGGLVGFLARSLLARAKPVFSLRLFLDRNYATACLVITALGLGMYGAMVIQPLMLESVLGYPIVTAGLLMMPRGIASAVSMMAAGRLVKRVDPRMLVAAGILVSAAGTHAMTHYSLYVNQFWLVWPVLLQGLGLGLIYVPLSTVAFSTLPREQSAEGAGLYSLVRTIGSSIGISIVATLLTRLTQQNWAEMAGHVQRYGGAVAEYLRPLHMSPTDPHALAVIANEVNRQASMVAMVDVFRFITWSFLAMVPLVLLLKAPPKGPAGGDESDAPHAAIAAE